jgi:hypothetical protein
MRVTWPQLHHDGAALQREILDIIVAAGRTDGRSGTP